MRVDHVLRGQSGPDFGTDYRLLTYNGRSWTKSARCGYTQFGQAACVSTKLCFLFGDAGKIHEWNGTTWTVLGGRFETDVDATACASASLRLALGETGGLIRYNGSRLSTAAMRTPGPVPARAGP